MSVRPADDLLVGRPTPGSDGPYKGFKTLSFYDPDKSHCHVVATVDDCQAVGRLVHREFP